MESPTAMRYRVSPVAILVVVWLLSAAYLWHGLGQEWVPHDEGAFGQSAQRLLAGELPHRDFDEIYTGGLTYLNALAFTWFGATLLSLRLMLYGFFLLWVPLLLYVMSRFVRPLFAAGLTLLGVLWSVPNYPAAVPSWYNLFFATAATAACCRYLESERRRWLLLAGLAAGLSCLFKIVGLYLAAALALFLVFIEQTRYRNERQNSGAVSTYTCFIWVCLATFVVLLARLVIVPHSTVGHVVHFVAPGASIAAIVAGFEWSRRSDSSPERFRYLSSIAWPCVLGFAVPVAAFAGYYATHGALGQLVSGVFEKPMKRVGFASMAPAPLSAMLPSTYLLLLFLGVSRLRRSMQWGVAVVMALLGTAILLAPYNRTGYQLAWFGISQSPPLVVLIGAVLVVGAGSRLDAVTPTPSIQARQLVLVLSVLALCALVQFPFAAPVYFMYVAPLLLVAATAVVAVGKWRSPALYVVLASFFAVFVVSRVRPDTIYHMGVQFIPDGERPQILIPGRADLQVPRHEAVEYAALVAEVRAHARGAFMYATPDSPQVYYLAGFRNPTGTLFDFFDDPNGRTPRILAAIERRNVNVVVLNRRPWFSGPVPRDLADSLEARYPHAIDVADFTVRWRE